MGLTRRLLLRRLGPEGFKSIGPIFPFISLLGMYSIIFLIFFGKATLILDRWETVIALLVPDAILIGGNLLLITWLDRRLGLGYAEHVAVAFTSTGKNDGTAIASQDYDRRHRDARAPPWLEASGELRVKVTG